jgi:acetamidase/formamidase
MATHRFQPTLYHITLGSQEPVLHIAAGDMVITTTIDSLGYDASGSQVSQSGNPQTGPFYVTGAAVGDTLVVHIDLLQPNRDWGFSGMVLAPNTVDPEALHLLPDNSKGEWQIDRLRGTATLIAPETAIGRLTVPLGPMLGCFGVAPARGQAISTFTSGEHGGNMDYPGFGAGVTVYLPVFVPGALFHLGDGHAAQGDGEIVGSGIEVSMDVQFTLDVRKDYRITWPRGENADYIFTVGNARPLDQAVQHATTEMFRWLTSDYMLDAPGASILLGQAVVYDLANIYNPAYSMVCRIAKRLLPSRAES